LHIDLDECLAGAGYEVNDETRAALLAAWRAMADQLGCELVEVAEVDVDEEYL
jgi:hypothetical protein